MIEKYLIILSSLIIFSLGTMHLVFTFFSNKFSPRDAETELKMKADFPLLTRRTTMWKAWVGFNASHSLGAMFFGLVNMIIAVQYFDVFQNANLLLLLDDVTLLFYLFLAKKYWFRIPLTGIGIATIGYFIATLMLV